MNWIYTEDQLKKKYEQKQDRYQKFLDQVHKSAELIKKTSPSFNQDPKKLNFDRFDEQIIVDQTMSNMIIQISRIFGKEKKFEIYHYALTLIRRYYLNNCLLDTDVNTMMYTCIIMAVKLSENKSVQIQAGGKTYMDIFEYALTEWTRYKVKGFFPMK